LPWKWKESLTAPIYKKADEADYSNYTGISIFQLRTNFYTTSCLKVNSIRKENYWVSSMWISTQQLYYCTYIYCIRQIIEKKSNQTKQNISSLQTLRKFITQLERKSCIIFSLSLVSRCNW